MTLDDEQIPWREQARRDREAYWREEWLEWQHQKASESVEAKEVEWDGTFAADPYPDTEYGFADGWLPVSSRGPHG